MRKIIKSPDNQPIGGLFCKKIIELYKKENKKTILYVEKAYMKMKNIKFFHFGKLLTKIK